MKSLQFAALDCGENTRNAFRCSTRRPAELLLMPTGCRPLLQRASTAEDEPRRVVASPREARAGLRRVMTLDASSGGSVLVCALGRSLMHPRKGRDSCGPRSVYTV